MLLSQWVFCFLLYYNCFSCTGGVKHDVSDVQRNASDKKITDAAALPTGSGNGVIFS